jgi:hypothetical protein
LIGRGPFLRKSNVNTEIYKPVLIEIRDSRKKRVKNINRFGTADSGALKIPAKFNTVARTLF